MVTSECRNLYKVHKVLSLNLLLYLLTIYWQFTASCQQNRNPSLNSSRCCNQDLMNKAV